MLNVSVFCLSNFLYIKDDSTENNYHFKNVRIIFLDHTIIHKKYILQKNVN